MVLIPEWLAWSLTPLPLVLPMVVLLALVARGQLILRQQEAEARAEAERFDRELRELIDQEGKR